MKKLLDVFVAGTPRPRASSNQWRQVEGMKGWMNAVRWSAKSKLVGVRPCEGSVEVWLTFYSKGRGDASNYAKAVEDALTKILYRDDEQIRELHVKMVWLSKESPMPTGVVILAYDSPEFHNNPLRPGPTRS